MPAVRKEPVPLHASVDKGKKSTIERLVSQLEKAFSEKMRAEGTIKRDGTQIIVPSHMTLEDASKAIIDYNNSLEETVEQNLEFKGHLNELLVAMDKGIRKGFGNFFSKGQDIQSFFGNYRQNARSYTVPISATESLTIPVGTLAIPGLPVELKISAIVSKTDPLASVMVINAVYKQKAEHLISMLKKSVEFEIQNTSIFKGKAINSNFEFLNLDSFPTDKIVYSEGTQRELDTHILCPLKYADTLESKGMHLRRSVLLQGEYGSGKSLTATYIAKVAIENGWTFLNSLTGESITNAIKFAEKYQPAVVFFEDVDQVTPHGRTTSVNEILNVVDGFLSKKSKVMIILTTNHTDKIEKAMLRPGRIDALIKMGEIDAKVISKMVEVYCPEMTNGVDIDRLLVASKGYTPSFISEAFHRSALYSISRASGNGNQPNITTDDLEDSLKGLRTQFDLMHANLESREESIDTRLVNIVSGQVSSMNEGIVEGVVQMLMDKNII